MAALAADPPACVVPMLHGESGEDGAIREVLDLLGDPVRRVGSGRLPHGVRQAGRQVGRRAGRHRHAGVGLPAARDVPRARRRPGDGRRWWLGSGCRSSSSPPAAARRWAARWSAAADELPDAMVNAFAYGAGGADRDASWRAPRSPSPSSTTAPAPGRCPRSRSGPTAASTTTPRATPPGSTEFTVPAELPDAVLAECARVAVAAHEALGLRDLSRSDLIVDDDGTVWFLEVNVAPGFTETSLVPLSVEAAGLDLGEVLAALGPGGVRARCPGAALSERHLLGDHPARQARLPGSRPADHVHRARAPPAHRRRPARGQPHQLRRLRLCRVPASTRSAAGAVHGQARALRPPHHRADHARLPPHRGRPRRRERSLAVAPRLPRPRRGGRHLPRGHHLPGHGDQGAQDRRGPDRRRGRRPARSPSCCGAPSA